jgi:hypothetical protein
MPRLRYRKDYNLDFEINERTDEETTSAMRYEGEEETERSGASWLSNGAIISSFTTAKLKTTLSQYKAYVKILETELLTRSFINRKHPAEYRILHRKNIKHITPSGDKQPGSKSLRQSRKRSTEVYEVPQLKRSLAKLKLNKVTIDAMIEVFNQTKKGA